MKRQFDPERPELMDLPQPVTPELKKDLENLRRLNRFFGSYALVRHFLRRWIKSGMRVRLVDLATGSGDIPWLAVDHARRVGAVIAVDAVDRQAATVEIARKLSAAYPEIAYHESDVLSFGRAAEYDVVLCSLALHHFSEDDAIRLLRRCRELSRRFVLVADLRRGWLATAGVYLLTALIFREPMTKIDGRLSARRAFSFGELRRLAEKAGWQNFQHRKFRFARQAISMELA